MSMAVPMVSPMKMSELDTRDSFVLRPGKPNPGSLRGFGALRGEGVAGPWRCHTLARIAGRCSAMPTDGRQSCPGLTRRQGFVWPKTRSLSTGVVDLQDGAGTRSVHGPGACLCPRRRPASRSSPGRSEPPGAQIPRDRAGAVPYRRDQLRPQLAVPVQPLHRARDATAPTGMRRRSWMGAATEATPSQVSSTSAAQPRARVRSSTSSNVLRAGHRARR